MRSTKAGPVLLALSAACLVGLVSCPAPTSDPLTPGPIWTFDADKEDWAMESFDSASLNHLAALSWSDTEGSPGAGALKVVVPFAETEYQYITIAAPITPNPLGVGADVTGKKFSVQVKSGVSFTGGAMLSSTSANATPPPDWVSGNGGLVPLATAG